MQKVKKSNLNRVFREEFGQYLKSKREDRSLSQAVVAEHLGYTGPQFISNIERGLCSVPLPKLKCMIHLYGIPVAEVTEIIVKHQKELLHAQLSCTGAHHRKKKAYA